MIATLILLGLCLITVAATGMTIVQSYNRLVQLKNRCDNAFAQIDVQMKRRYDLIPNLVEAVKGYLSHERETLEAVIEARNQASTQLDNAAKNPSDPNAVQSFIGSEGALTSALGRMNFVMEQYPELKGNENVADLTEELTHTENRVAFARQSFNDLVMLFNSYRQTFPTVVFSSLVGFPHDRQMLEFADAAAIQEAPQVSLSAS